MWVLAYDLSQPDAAVKVYNCTLEQGITVDALVNNAGFGDFGSFWEVDPKRQADLMYQTPWRGAAHTLLSAEKRMQKDY